MFWRVDGDSHMQMMLQLALEEAMPMSKKSMVERHECFCDAWAVIIHQYSMLRRADAVRVQSELVNISQKPAEAVITYVDRVESLWQELDGTVPEPYAVDHMRRGLSPDQGPLFAMLASTAADTFDAVRSIVLRNKDARVSRKVVGTSDGSDVLSQLQQLQLQHAQLQRRLDSQSGNRSHKFTNDSRPRQTNWSSGPRQQGYLKRTPSNRPVPPRDRAGGSFQHTVGSAEISAVDFSGAHEVSAVDGGIPLSICADSGATTVVTPIREALTD